MGEKRPPPESITITVGTPPDEAPHTIREAAFGLPRIGETIGGHYVVEAPIGAGGMGHVLRVRDTEGDRVVAVKILDPSLATETAALERFAREVKTLAAFAVKSPHGVQVYDTGTLENGLPYVVMELLDGKDLGDVAEERGRLPIDEACSLILQACEVVAEAHAAGIVHRDLKPRNLFYTKDVKGRPCVRVLDFGIARALGNALGPQLTITRAGDFVGTLSYMAPEQIRNAKMVDPRMDVWALGACLYRLVVGRAPFRGDTEFALIEAVLRDEPPGMGTLPLALAAVIGKCLEKKPSHRYKSVTAFAEALSYAQDATSGIR